MVHCEGDWESRRDVLHVVGYVCTIVNIIYKKGREAGGGTIQVIGTGWILVGVSRGGGCISAAQRVGVVGRGRLNIQ